MFAYVDETGNTGANIFDENQPVYMTGAMMVQEEFDEHHSTAIQSITASISCEELHAAELGVGGIVRIADAVAEVLRKARAEFYFCRVVKLDLGAGKFFDTFFDSGENVAVPWQCYNVRPLRLMLMLKAAYLLDEDLLRLFWTSLLHLNEATCQAGFVECLQRFRKRIHILPDARSKQILGEATDWAIAHPEVIEAHSTTRSATYGHLPNMVAFSMLLMGIEQQSQAWSRPVRSIIHDEQQQFGKSLADWHEIFSNAAPDPLYMPLGEKIIVLRAPGSHFLVKRSAQSAALQVCDVCLWCMKQVMAGKRFPRECDALLYQILSRSAYDEVSLRTAEATVQRFSDETSDPSGEQLERARELVELGEQKRRERMEEYARRKGLS